ncbi:MAG: outer membrane beta-barrel domain-containing protein [Deltaproteobacteria bacterium]|nr:outer membrane beta-barrel domain-containing protein [Deltaproteobacteria bacterium]
MKLAATVTGLATLCLLAGVASAQTADETEKYIRVVQQKPFVKALRAEVMPAFVASLNEQLTSHIGVGLNARFHITDEWSVGGEYVKYFGKMATLATEIGDEYQVYPEKHLMDFYAGVNATYTPLFGKFLLFGGPLVNWDLYLLAGGGVTRSTFRNRITGEIGLGMRFVVTQWMSVNFELRDYMFTEPYHDSTEFVNNVTFVAGIGLFAPFGHNYVFPK